MTRATLLQVLARPTALGPAEVRELEQLAQAFPYCQTAHLLLAKAAHDHGTMLAGQRLRRAATYAADRTLLRRLIEEVEPAPLAPEPAPITEPAPTSAATATPAAPVAELLPMAAPASTMALQTPALPGAAPAAEVAEVPAPVAPALIPAVTPAAPTIPETTDAVEPIVETAAPVLVTPVPVQEERAAPPALTQPPAETADTEETVAAVVAPATAPVADIEPVAPPEAAEAAPAPTEPATVDVAPVPAEPVSAETQDTPAEVAPMPAAEAVPEPEPALVDAPPKADETEADEIEAAAATPEALDLPALVDQEGVSITATAPVPELVPEAAPEEEPDLPAQAPAIRPPVEVGEARFEFGLAEPPPLPPAYELPGLVDEWAAAAVTLNLGSPEPASGFASTGSQGAPAPPVFTPAAFTGDEAIGYGFGESSRLGFSMQLLGLLTDKAEQEAAEKPLAEPPASPLPPVGAFFEPDPLLLDHWATHCPPAPVLPSSLDLINNFLKRQPRLSRPAMLPPAPGGQADLSVRSTRAEPDLVSENLARIFVRQGKTARAIEIYEKLMVKQPEKSAHFKEQIEALNAKPPIS